MPRSFLKRHLKGIGLLGAALLLLGLLTHPLSAQRDRIVVRMASMAPDNSEWDFALEEMAARWREASNGRVELLLYPGGQGGEEEDVLRRMRIGQFNAGGFTIAGLQNLTPSVVVLAIPLLMETQEDLHRVREALGPKLEEVFLEEGYVLLQWVDLGWMRFFVPDPDPSPDAIRSYKYVQWGESSLNSLWREAGFPPGVRLNIADVTVGLQTGLVEAINTAPLVVAGYQWFTKLPYMIDLRWAPLSGATLIDRRTWDRIPEELRPVLKDIARETQEKVQASLLTWENEAIEAMKSQGLQVIQPPPEVLEEWRTLFGGSWDMLKGDIIPEDWFDEAVRLGQQGRGR